MATRGQSGPLSRSTPSERDCAPKLASRASSAAAGAFAAAICAELARAGHRRSERRALVACARQGGAEAAPRTVLFAEVGVVTDSAFSIAVVRGALFARPHEAASICRMATAEV